MSDRNSNENPQQQENSSLVRDALRRFSQSSTADWGGEKPMAEQASRENKPLEASTESVGDRRHEGTSRGHAGNPLLVAEAVRSLGESTGDMHTATSTQTAQHDGFAPGLLSASLQALLQSGIARHSASQLSSNEQAIQQAIHLIHQTSPGTSGSTQPPLDPFMVASVMGRASVTVDSQRQATQHQVLAAALAQQIAHSAQPCVSDASLRLINDLLRPASPASRLLPGSTKPSDRSSTHDDSAVSRSTPQLAGQQVLDRMIGSATSLVSGQLLGAAASRQMPALAQSNATGTYPALSVTSSATVPAEASASDPSSLTRVRRAYTHESFPVKLHRILREAAAAGHDDIVCFTESGDGFFIRQPNAFAKMVIPKYFRHSRLKSFQRQLSMYGFKRAREWGTDNGAYKHELFHRDRPELCKDIQRIGEDF